MPLTQEILDERQKKEKEGRKKEGRRKKQEKRGRGEEGLRFSTVIFQRVGKGEEELTATSAELEMGVLFFSHISFSFSHWMNTDQYSPCPAAAAKSLQLCPSLRDPIDGSPSGSPASLGFSRQEHWSGLPFPSPMHENEK